MNLGHKLKMTAWCGDQPASVSSSLLAAHRKSRLSLNDPAWRVREDPRPDSQLPTPSLLDCWTNLTVSTLCVQIWCGQLSMFYHNLKTSLCFQWLFPSRASQSGVSAPLCAVYLATLAKREYIFFFLAVVTFEPHWTSSFWHSTSNGKQRQMQTAVSQFCFIVHCSCIQYSCRVPFLFFLWTDLPSSLYLLCSGGSKAAQLNVFYLFIFPPNHPPFLHLPFALSRSLSVPTWCSGSVWPSWKPWPRQLCTSWPQCAQPLPWRRLRCRLAPVLWI